MAISIQLLINHVDHLKYFTEPVERFSSLSVTQHINSTKTQFNIIPIRRYEHFSFTEGLSHFLKRRIKYGLPRFRRQRPHFTDSKPFITGIVLKTLIKKPKKPNSANRKCVRVRLSTGKEVTAHVPGIGHNLQEHHKVLVRGGKTKDLPGVKHKCVRGKFDLPHIKKPT